MSEHTENIRRAVTTGLGKLVDALDDMEKERDEANERVKGLEARAIGLEARIKGLGGV